MRPRKPVYAGFNDTHLTEKLRERHHLTVSREPSADPSRQGREGSPAVPFYGRTPAADRSAGPEAILPS